MARVNLKTGKIIEEEKFISSTPEKELQEKVEKHLNQFFQSYLLKSYYSIPGGIIDTLAITEDGNPCIIEFKHEKDEKIINQIVFYYDWLQERATKYEFERIVKENKITQEIKVDWSKVRLITVAKQYTKWDISLIKHLDSDIECHSYTYHKDELDVHLDPIINQYKKTKLFNPQSNNTTKSYTLDTHRNKASKDFLPYFDEIRREILNLGKDVEEGYVTEYIKYVVNTMFAEVHVKKQKLAICLRVNESNFKDPKKLTKDISSRKWSTTREFRVDKNTEIKDAIYLIKQAHDYQK